MFTEEEYKQLIQEAMEYLNISEDNARAFANWVQEYPGAGSTSPGQVTRFLDNGYWLG